MTNTWVALAILIGLLVAMIGGLKLLRSRYTMHAELSRKVAHVSLGVAMLSCPFLFKSVWPVAILALTAVASLAAMRWIPFIAQRFGGVVGGVARGSAGDFFFPLAAAALFVVADGDLILYGIPILTLTFADATAALIGVFYGKLRLETGATPKTVEGSIAFFVVAFLTTLIPLMLLSKAGQLEMLLIAVMFGFLVMLLEVVSVHGTDNLFVPFGGYLFLKAFLAMSVAQLASVVVAAGLLFALALLLWRRTSLNDAATLAGVLFAFLAWSVGGWRWLVPPVSMFLSYNALWPRPRNERVRPHDLNAVAAVVTSGLVWMMLFDRLDAAELYYPYTITFALQLCFVGITWHRVARTRMHATLALARSAMVAWATLFIPFALVSGPEGWRLAALAPLWIAAGGITYTVFLRSGRELHGRDYPWWPSTVVAFGASALGLWPLGRFWGAP